MNHEIYEYLLSPEQFHYVKRTFFRDELIANLLNRSGEVIGQKSVIRVDRGDAEHLRAKLTEQLAKVGFDKDYVLTPEGEMLEELIDQFSLHSLD